jgi:MHS family shikimate/dehydroshikimate transporter-like MFS transporter
MLTKNKRSKTPLVDLFRNGKRTVAISIGLKVTEVAWVGVMTVFAVFYLTRKMGIDRGTVLTAITIATFLEIFVIPMSGWLSDRIGRRVIYLFGTVFGICFAFPMFWLFDTRDPTIITLTMIAGICIGQGVMFALHASFLPELFATQVRYTGISLGFQVGSAIGGGLTPLFSAMAVSWDGGATWPVSVVLVFLGILTLIATIASRGTSDQTI